MFRFDGPVMGLLTKLTYIIYAHILAFLCCVPVITAGAGFTALEYVLLKISRDEETNITSDFFRSFKENFKDGTLMWLLYLVVGSFVMFDIYVLLHEDMGINKLLLVLTYILGIALVLNMTWGFVLLSRYKNSAMQTVKYSFSVCIVHIGPTLCMLALVGIPLFLALFSFEALPYAVVIGSILSGWARPILYGKVFEKIEKANEEKSEDETVLEKEI